jgi:multiple sugar transport system permease protein
LAEYSSDSRTLAPATARSAVTQKGTAGARSLTPYLFLTPFLLLFGVFVLVPLVYAAWISLHEWNYLLPNQPWTGLSNFTDLVASGSASGRFFWQSMGATGKFVLFSVPPLVVVPLLVALVLNQRFHGRTFFRALYFAPYVLGVAVVGLL